MIRLLKVKNCFKLNQYFELKRCLECPSRGRTWYIMACVFSYLNSNTLDQSTTVPPSPQKPNKKQVFFDVFFEQKNWRQKFWASTRFHSCGISIVEESDRSRRHSSQDFGLSHYFSKARLIVLCHLG